MASGNIHVGVFDIGVARAAKPEREYLSPLREWVLKYIKTGKIENEAGSVRGYLKQYAYTDFNAKYDHLARRGKFCEYVPSLAVAALPAVPAVCMSVSISKVGVTIFGRSVTLLRPALNYTLSNALKSLAVVVLASPLCLAIAYATLPREKLSVFRLRTEARRSMDDEGEAVDCLEVVPGKDIKGPDGEDIVTGSRITKRYTKLNRPKRTPYAAKIAQVARSKVGYLKNTPENRLIYQRVMIEIMDKDHVRYHDRDFILPLAIGCCFVYPDGVEESSALWGSEESLGVK
nr:MAG: hypothetical protein 1 [Tombusvirus sp.]